MCSHCGYETKHDVEPNDLEFTNDESMTIEKCREQNLSVFMFGRLPSSIELRDQTAISAQREGRKVVQFTQTVHGFLLHVVAVGPRIGSGEIAKHMKALKK